MKKMREIWWLRFREARKFWKGFVSAENGEPLKRNPGFSFKRGYLYSKKTREDEKSE